MRNYRGVAVFELVGPYKAHYLFVSGDIATSLCGRTFSEKDVLSYEGSPICKRCLSRYQFFKSEKNHA